MARYPNGIRALIPPWARPDRIMAGYDAFTSAAGQLAYISVYNNSQTGAYLYVIGALFSTNNNNGLIFESFLGAQGQIAASPGAFPIYSGSGQLDGVMGHFGNAACVGNHIGGSGNANINSMVWPYDWPMAIVAPGWSFAVQTTGTAANVSGGFWWYVGKPPRGQ